ncbi:hypothetical protein ColLi_13261 [Colletotrichum liriopes]|uniref:Uncharacterized protein n=1 Tax=Colletotrichum liriopes TaxID=708192 RepID=A0AA37GZW5_9PEZI|nr:hypothetical protein ColLi_13261 [Colletotrichum liriopes]
MFFWQVSLSYGAGVLSKAEQADSFLVPVTSRVFLDLASRTVAIDRNDTALRKDYADERMDKDRRSKAWFLTTQYCFPKSRDAFNVVSTVGSNRHDDDDDNAGDYNGFRYFSAPRTPSIRVNALSLTSRQFRLTPIRTAAFEADFGRAVREEGAHDAESWKQQQQRQRQKPAPTS